MSIGEEGFVSVYDVITSNKGGRVFICWDAILTEAPENPCGPFSALRIQRLKRGFSLTVRPSDSFQPSPLPWGLYAPVIDILQAAPTPATKTEGKSGGCH